MGVLKGKYREWGHEWDCPMRAAIGTFDGWEGVGGCGGINGWSGVGRCGGVGGWSGVGGCGGVGGWSGVGNTQIKGPALLSKCSKLRVEEVDRRTKGLEASQDHVRKKRREKALYGTVRHRELSRERKEMGAQKGKCQERGTSGTVQQGQLSGILGHGEVGSGDRCTKGVDTVQTQAGVSKRGSTQIQVDLDEKWGNMCTVPQIAIQAQWITLPSQTSFGLLSRQKSQCDGFGKHKRNTLWASQCMK
ncbi:hypothetical protein BC827DRAFT_1156510 [Russula dissimulans]|nr:hypothetical protein BC827DRAFT_1156510 [Russula dissimulans]